MEQLFSLFSDYTFQVVAIGAFMLGIVNGAIGCFTVVRKQCLLGDCISHSALPGVIIAFLITKEKSCDFLLLGGIISGLLSTFLLMYIMKNSRIKYDSAISIILSVFFGFGIVLLTLSQKIPNANQAGLDRYIYGQASSLLLQDLKIILLSGTFLIFLLFVFYKEFKLMSFDSQFLKSLGYNYNILDFLLTLMTVISIVIGLQTVGAILMSSMLIAPAISARQWVNSFSKMIFLSAFLSGICGILGVILSSLLSIPTGPSIVICLTFVVFVSILFSKNRGLIYKFIYKFLLSLKMKRGDTK